MYPVLPPVPQQFFQCDAIEDPNCSAGELHVTQKVKITKYHVNALHNRFISNVNGNWDHSSDFPTKTDAKSSATNFKNGNRLASTNDEMTLEGLCERVVPQYNHIIMDKIPKDLSHIKFTKNYKAKRMRPSSTTSALSLTKYDNVKGHVIFKKREKPKQSKEVKEEIKREKWKNRQNLKEDKKFICLDDRNLKNDIVMEAELNEFSTENLEEICSTTKRSNSEVMNTSSDVNNENVCDDNDTGDDGFHNAVSTLDLTSSTTKHKNFVLSSKKTLVDKNARQQQTNGPLLSLKTSNSIFITSSRGVFGNGKSGSRNDDGASSNLNCCGSDSIPKENINLGSFNNLTDENRSGVRIIRKDTNANGGQAQQKMQQFKEWHEIHKVQSFNGELLTILPYVVID